MKIAILTLPLTNNYGGHLQAWALQKVLRKEGYNPVLLDIRRSDERMYHYMIPLKKLLSFIIKLLPGKKDYHYLNYRKYQELNFQQFRDTELVKTKPINGRYQLKTIFKKENFDAIVVGSDQVWRKWKMIPLDLYYLSWLNSDIKRIGYAISYGIDKWELNDEIRKYCRLAQLFNGLSMRENEGVKMTKDFLGLDSELVLDPTMLLEVEDYKLIINNSSKNSSKSLFYYILDNTEKKKEMISLCSEVLDYPVFEVMPKVRWFDAMKKYPKTDYIYPPIQEWLSSFDTVSFVVTDSFHGTVFSIIFNKPFIVLGNQYRGLSRIFSLLKVFGIENRLIVDFDKNSVLNIINNPIDWKRVNQIREVWKMKSIEFINRHLRS